MTAFSIALVRDAKWLTLEVCREFQRGTCSRADADCKFAHPPRICNVENGRVVAVCARSQLYLILCDPMDCRLPASSGHGISQARILK